jgi:acyl-CoA thioesterase-1
MLAQLGQMVGMRATFNVFSLILLLAGPAWAEPAPIRIVAFGDSLTAGYMLRSSEAFPAQLQRKLASSGYSVEIVNAGVSGDTTAAGLARLDWSVPEGTDAVILELGANDALRGLDPAMAKRNLDRILARLKERGIEVLLTGMLAPANYGESYARSFNAIFPDLAKQHDVLLYPFFLQGVAMRSNLNLSDGLHPNAEGAARIVEGIAPVVEQLIARVRERRLRGQRG